MFIQPFLMRPHICSDCCFRLFHSSGYTWKSKRQQHDVSIQNFLSQWSIDRASEIHFFGSHFHYWSWTGGFGHTFYTEMFRSRLRKTLPPQKLTLQCPMWLHLFLCKWRLRSQLRKTLAQRRSMLQSIGWLDVNKAKVRRLGTTLIGKIDAASPWLRSLPSANFRSSHKCSKPNIFFAHERVPPWNSPNNVATEGFVKQYQKLVWNWSGIVSVHSLFTRACQRQVYICQPGKK